MILRDVLFYLDLLCDGEFPVFECVPPAQTTGVKYTLEIVKRFSFPGVLRYFRATS